MLTHWSSQESSNATDKERVTFMATSPNLQRLYTNFRRCAVSSSHSDVANSIWFLLLKNMLIDLYLCAQPSCEAVGSDQHLFPKHDRKARPQGTTVTGLLLLELRFSYLVQLQVYCMCNCAYDTVGMEAILEVDIWLWLAVQVAMRHFLWPIKLSFVWSSISNSDNYSLFRDITKLSAYVRYLLRQWYDERIPLATSMHRNGH